MSDDVSMETHVGGTARDKSLSPTQTYQYSGKILRTPQKSPAKSPKGQKSPKGHNRTDSFENHEISFGIVDEWGNAKSNTELVTTEKITFTGYKEKKKSKDGYKKKKESHNESIDMRTENDVSDLITDKSMKTRTIPWKDDDEEELKTENDEVEDLDSDDRTLTAGIVDYSDNDTTLVEDESMKHDRDSGKDEQDGTAENLTTVTASVTEDSSGYVVVVEEASDATDDVVESSECDCQKSCECYCVIDRSDETDVDAETDMDADSIADDQEMRRDSIDTRTNKEEKNGYFSFVYEEKRITNSASCAFYETTETSENENVAKHVVFHRESSKTEEEQTTDRHLCSHNEDVDAMSECCGSEDGCGCEDEDEWEDCSSDEEEESEEMDSTVVENEKYSN